MSQCLCLKDNGKQCKRNASTQSNHNPQFCWQHQRCQKILTTPSHENMHSFVTKSSTQLINKVDLPKVDHWWKIDGYVPFPQLENKGFACYFFSNSITLPSEKFQELINNSVETTPVKKMGFMVPYDGYMIRIFYDKNFEIYKVSDDSIEKDYLVPKYGSKSTFVNKYDIINQINQLLEGDLKNQITETEYMDNIVFDPRPPVNGNIWFSFLLDISTQKIVAFYRGVFDIDDSQRLYTFGSLIELKINYRGQGLCEPFASMTYRTIVEKLGVKYIKLYVAALIRVGACRCYIAAGLSNGFRCFLWQETQDDEEEIVEIFNKDQCSIFGDQEYVFPEIIITNGIDYDQVMSPYPPI